MLCKHVPINYCRHVTHPVAEIARTTHACSPDQQIRIGYVQVTMETKSGCTFQTDHQFLSTESTDFVSFQIK